jgi:hypothetical protein
MAGGASVFMWANLHCAGIMLLALKAYPHHTYPLQALNTTMHVC